MQVNGAQTEHVLNGFLQVIENMERETGFEPATSSLGSWRSNSARPNSWHQDPSSPQAGLRVQERRAGGFGMPSFTSMDPHWP